MGSSQAKPVDDLSAAVVPVPLTPDMTEHEKGIATKAYKEKLYANLKSSYKPDEANKHVNLIEVVHNEDYDSANYLYAMNLPMQVQKQLEKAQEREALRFCFPDEKKMAFCLQDKMWTAWKCQKERDAYYACLEEKKSSKDLLMDMKWKYTIGTFQGETMARGNIMKQVWKEHFPSTRDIPHQWVQAGMVET
jgi:hypothetical protein